MKTILYSIPQGYFARNLLRTGVLQRLLKNEAVRIVILSPAYNDTEFVKEFSFNGRIFHEPIFDYNVYAHSNWFEILLWKLCYFSWYKLHQRFLHLSASALRDFYYDNFNRRFYDETFAKYKPDLVITSTTGFTSGMDIPVIREANRLGIKTLCLIHSWDNIAGGKGILFVRPDFLGVWNELQKKEATDLHFYSSQNVFIVGPPNFDIYQEKEICISRQEFFQKLGLDLDKKLITFAEATMNSTENTYIIDILLDALEKNRFTFPAQLLVRLHPRRQFERSKKIYMKYFDNPIIKFDSPGGYHKILKWFPDRQQMVHLANTIRHSDVIINVASTVTIEAAILDRPVVNMGFSSSEPERFKKWVKNIVWKYHFNYVRERNCSYFAKDPEDVISGINMYLEHPQHHREGRVRLARDICYKLDGKATERIANLILEMVK